MAVQMEFQAAFLMIFHVWIPTIAYSTVHYSCPALIDIYNLHTGRLRSIFSEINNV